MPLININCPQCYLRFSKSIDNVPDDGVIGASCPCYNHEFELLLDESTIQIINLEELRRLLQGG